MVDREKMFMEKEETAKKCGCKYYIHLNGEEVIIIRFKDRDMLVLMNHPDEEYVITEVNQLICVTGNSNWAIEQEVGKGTKAIGYVGTIDAMWYADCYEKIL